MFYECIGLSTATRLCDIRVVTAMSDVTVRLLSEYFSLRLLVHLRFFINIIIIFYFLTEGNIFELITI